LIVMAGGFTPIPYKVIAIASGIAGLDPLVFALGSAVSRGSRFFLEAALLSRYGEPFRRFIEGHLVLLIPLLTFLLLGGFLLLRRTMLDELGGFDEGFRLYGEDIDLCYRAAKAGWERWYVPDAVVTHHHQAVTDRRFFTRRTFVALLEQAGLAVEELAVTPVPLPLIVPGRLHGAWLYGLHAASAAASRGWKSGLAYQFVALCRRRAAGRSPALASAAGVTGRAP
jgi:GT2 family glycosyltransferase